MRSRVEVTLTDGRTRTRQAHERYRGGPENPLTDDGLKAKFVDCTQSILSETKRNEVIETIYRLDVMKKVSRLIELATTVED